MKKRIGKILVATAFMFAGLTVADIKGTFAEGAEKSATVYNFEELQEAFLDSDVSTIYVADDIDVPCGNNDFDSDYKSKSAALVADRNLVIEGLNGETFTLKRYVANETDGKGNCRSIIEVYGDGNYDGIQVSIKNLVLDGGAIWNTESVSEIYSSSKSGIIWSTNDGYAGRAIVDVANKGTINLEYGCVLRNSQVSVNSQTRQPVSYSGSGSSCYGAGIRIEYSDSFGGGTANLKMGAVIEDCSSVNWGGAIGSYNYGRLHIYGGTIRRCASETGAAICCTYRSGTPSSTASIMKMYGGTVEDCYSRNTGIINIDGSNSTASEFTGGIIRNCNGYAINVTENAKLDIADYDGENIQISGVSSGNLQANAYTAKQGIQYSKIDNITFVDSFIILFMDGNNSLGNISIKKNEASGPSFPADPVKNGYIFNGWYANDNTRIDANTIITKNLVINADWTNLHVHGDVTYEAADYSVTATCNKAEYAFNCEYKNVSVRFRDINDTTYMPGRSVENSLVYSPSIKAWEVVTGITNQSAIFYEKLDKNGTWTSMGTEAPVNVGTYRAYTTVGEYTIYSNEYKINPIVIKEISFAEPKVEAGLILTGSEELNIAASTGYLADIQWFAGSKMCNDKTVCGFNTVYQGVIELEADENYCFDSEVLIDESWSVDDIASRNITISKSYRTRRANIYTVNVAETIKLSSAEAYFDEAIELLPETLECEVDAVMEEGGIEKHKKDLTVEWNLIGTPSETEILDDVYNQSVNAVNIFKWSLVDENDIYDITSDNGSGTVDVENGAHVHSYTEENDTRLHTCIECEATRKHHFEDNKCVQCNMCAACKECAIEIQEVAASCTETGTKAHYKCEICGRIYLDADCGSVVDEKDLVIPAKGHDYKTVITKATTSKNGIIQKVCACGAIAFDKTIIYYPKTVTLSVTSYTYDGNAKKPTVTVKDSSGKTIAAKNSDGTVNYTVAYLDASGKSVTPKAIGTYTVKITMKGNYGDTISKTYKIVPKKTTIGTPAIATDGITVKWTKNTSCAGYYIYRSVNGAAYSKVKTITSNATVSWKDTTAKTNGNKYQYKIVAYKTVSGTTYTSVASAIKTTYFLTRPTVTLANQASAIKVAWAKNAKATGYYVYKSTDGGKTYKKVKTVTSNATVNYTDTSAKTNGTKYMYKVEAYKTVSGTTYKSVASAVKTYYFVSKPTISSLTNSAAGKMLIKWARNAKASGYEIQYSTSSSFTSPKSVTATGTTTTLSKTIASLTKGKTYYVRIRSYKTVGTTKYYSTWSATKSVKIVK